MTKIELIIDKAFKFSLWTLAVIFSVWFVMFIGIFVTGSIDFLVYSRTENQGEYLGFNVGMSKAEAVEVINSRYMDKKAVRFNGNSGSEPAQNREHIERLSDVRPEHLIDMSRWFIVFGGYNNIIVLDFSGDELVSVRRTIGPEGI